MNNFQADQHLFDQVTERMTDDQPVQQSACVNDRDPFGDANRDKLKSAIFERHDENQDIVSRIARDEEFGETVIDLLLGRFCEEAQRRPETSDFSDP